MKTREKTNKQKMCAFISQHGDKCSESTYAGYEFCRSHLRQITESNISIVSFRIVSEQLGVSLSEVQYDSNIDDDLGADSLDGVELVMAFEEMFDTEIPDEEAKDISSVSDIIEIATRKVLDEKEEFILKPEIDFVVLNKKIRKQASNIERQINTIVHSTLFGDYATKFRISQEALFKTFLEIMHTHWIDHVTTIPVTDDSGDINGAYIIFLTSRYVYYFYLGNRIIQAERAHLRDLVLNEEFVLDETGNIESIIVSWSLKYPTQQKKNRFSFESEQGIYAVREFMKKYWEHMEGLQ